jgi:hypothetical protein
MQARKALASMLDNLSFISVVSVQANGPNYIGEGVEIHFRHDKERPKSVFFDKFGRNRTSLVIGPIHLAQCPMGPDHPSSLPSVGEILVGSLVPNTRKSHLQFVLRGWSSDAKPLKELLRILKFGTKATEFEMKSSLIQPCSLLMMSPESIKKSRDDVYLTARVILWSSLRPLQVLASIEEPEKFSLDKAATEEEISMAKQIKISLKASEFIDCLVLKLADQELADAFISGLTIKVQEYNPAHYAPPPPPPPTGQPLYNYVPYNASVPSHGYSPPSPQYAPTSPEYAPTSPPESLPPSPKYYPSAKTPPFEEL